MPKKSKIKDPNRKSLIETVADTQEISLEEAIQQVRLCKEDLNKRLEGGELPLDILEEWFGLEPDWLDEIL